VKLDPEDCMARELILIIDWRLVCVALRIISNLRYGKARYNKEDHLTLGHLL